MTFAEFTEQMKASIVKLGAQMSKQSIQISKHDASARVNELPNTEGHPIAKVPLVHLRPFCANCMTFAFGLSEDNAIRRASLETRSIQMRTGQV